MRCKACGLVFADYEARDKHYPCRLCAYCWLPVNNCVRVGSHKYHPGCFAVVSTHQEVCERIEAKKCESD